MLKFKGPTVSPRDEDLDLLVEVGLGITRRFNEERAKQGRPALGPEETALWYLANRLGRRLLRGWERRVPGLRWHGPGVWCGEVLAHPVFLVSGTELPVEEASLPLHLISREPGETEQEIARLVAGRAELWERYGGWLASLHPAAYQEVQGMARQTKQPFRLDLTPIIEAMGVEWVIEQLGAKRVIAELGAKRVIAELGAKRVIDGLGAKQVIDELGGLKQFWAKLTP